MVRPNMDASILSEKQQSRTIRSKISIPKKSTLQNPLQIQWPQLEEENSRYIKEELTKTFISLGFSFAEKKHKHSQSEDDTKKRPGFTEDQKQYMSLLTRGIRDTTKALEKDNLSLCLVDKSAHFSQMTSHLLSLTVVRQCPAAAIHELGRILYPLLGFSPITIGFKKCYGDDEPSVFDTLVSDIIEKIPVIELPWLDTNEDVNEKDTEPTTIRKEENMSQKINSSSHQGEITFTHSTQQQSISIKKELEDHHLKKYPNQNVQRSSVEKNKFYILKSESKVLPRLDIFSSCSYITLSSENKNSTATIYEEQFIDRKRKIESTDGNKLSNYCPPNIQMVSANPNKRKRKSFTKST